MMLGQVLVQYGNKIVSEMQAKIPAAYKRV
jgi:hypothetical protein